MVEQWNIGTFDGGTTEQRWWKSGTSDGGTVEHLMANGGRVEYLVVEQWNI